MAISKGQVFTAFILTDDKTWRQPSFRISRKATKPAIEQALLRQYGGFAVYGLCNDNEAPEGHIELLKIELEREYAVTFKRTQSQTIYVEAANETMAEKDALEILENDWISSETQIETEVVN